MSGYVIDLSKKIRLMCDVVILCKMLNFEKYCDNF